MYYRTYGWWIGADVTRSLGLAHSPLALLFLAIPVFAVGVLVATVVALARGRLRHRALYAVSSSLLLLAILGCVALPTDSLSSMTIALLGPGKRGDALLFNSAATGQTRTVRTLLDAGAKLRPGEGLAYIGATYGKVEVIKMGIERGDDINAVGYRGYTPLRSAIVNQQPEAIEFLLANGAKPTDADRDGISALRKEVK